MVVPPVPGISVVGHINDQWPIQPEREHALGRQLHPSSTRYRLAHCARTGTRCGSNRCSLAAAGDSSDNSPEQGSTPHVLTRSFIDTYAFLSLAFRGRCLGRCAHRIASPLDLYSFEVHYNVTARGVPHD